MCVFVLSEGVPKKNGKRHASEVAMLSLHILKELRDIKIPHMPQKRFHVRVGCHTGMALPVHVGLHIIITY